MDTVARQALALTTASSARDRTVEITTTGGRSGLPHRIEIWFYAVRGRIFLSGMPGRTPDWYRNLLVNPRFTFHITHDDRVDLKATAVPVENQDDRREIFGAIVADLNQPSNPGRIQQPTAVADWLDGSVLLEILFDD